jgi:hypothetical protein
MGHTVLWTPIRNVIVSLIGGQTETTHVLYTDE